MPSSSIERTHLVDEASAQKPPKGNTSTQQNKDVDIQSSHAESDTILTQLNHKSDPNIEPRSLEIDGGRQFETEKANQIRNHNLDNEGSNSVHEGDKEMIENASSPELLDHLPHLHAQKLNGSSHSNNSNNSNTSNTSVNSSHSRQTSSTHHGQLKKSQHSHTKLKTHNRSSSHNKIQTNVPKLSLSNSAAANRPNLGRSKSTDGLIKSTHRNNNLKRNNRSLTKLTALQPLTRTISNQSIKSSLRPLTKTMLNQSIRSNKSNTSLKNLAGGNNVVQLSGLKTSGRKGKAILKFNDDYKDDEYEEDASEDSEDESNVIRQQVPPANFTQQQLQQLQKLQASNNKSSNLVGIDLNNFSVVGQIAPGAPVGSTAQIQLEPNLTHHVENPEPPTISHLSEIPAQTKSDSHVITASQLKQTNQDSTFQGSDVNDVKNTSTVATNDNSANAKNKQVPTSAQSSTDDLISSNMYGGSLLLSQSTGLTKKIDAKAGGPDQVYTTNAYNNGTIPVPKHSNNESLGSNNSESISGISFKANPIEKANAIVAEPVITHKKVAAANSYQPNQSIFNNLQRTNSQFASTKKPQQFNNDANNFADFLKNGRSNNNHSHGDNHHFHGGHGEASSHGTRTQQRLWLQRENSLMDVSGADHYKMSTLSNMSLNKLMINPYGSSSNVRDLSTPNAIQGISGTPTGGAGPSNALTPTADSNASMNNINGLFLMAQNRHQNPIQSRTEFERLNREYLNVRRHLNPVAETLTRVDEILSHTKAIEPPKRKEKKGAAATLSSLSLHSSLNNVNSFKEFSPLYQEKAEEVSKTMEKMWNEALLENSSANNSARSPNQQRGPQQHQFQQQQIQQMQQLRDMQYAQQQQQQQQHLHQQPGAISGSMRTQQPTTRKLAAQAAAQQKQQRLRGGLE